MLGKKQLQKIFKLPLLLPREKAISVVRNSPLFDKDWYLSTYPDIKNAGVDSAGHFFSIGWLEGRDPSYLFNTKEYLRKHHISFCPLLLEKEPYLPREVFFSIVVASYNYREELQICLDSLISQNYSNFEIIVVDDGSCDGSIELIESYCDKFPFIRFYHHPGRENKGLPETVNLGVSQARGKYIAFCESDDYWTDDHLFELNKFIQKASLNTQDCGILGGGTDI
ncbi:MAG: glycosyltransferase, partial [Turicimonas muris]